MEIFLHQYSLSWQGFYFILHNRLEIIFTHIHSNPLQYAHMALTTANVVFIHTSSVHTAVLASLWHEDSTFSRVKVCTEHAQLDLVCRYAVAVDNHKAERGFCVFFVFLS